jgi:hypothetical protein
MHIALKMLTGDHQFKYCGDTMISGPAWFAIIAALCLGP